MSYFPQVNTQLEISASTQLKTTPGHFLKFLIHLKGTSGVWRVWDAASTPPTNPGDTPGQIVGAWFADDPKAGAGSIVEVDWPCKAGIFLEVPPGGVCSAEWI
jgi:hypothetical protein